MINNEIVGTKEAAAFLNTSITSIASLIKNKEIKASKVNHRWLIHKKELERFKQNLLKELT